MSGLLINLIIQIISGAIGGNVAGGAAKNIDLGTLGNTIAGAIGGGAGGQILGMLIPLLANSASTPDIGSIIGQVAGGGVAGAVLTAIVGAIKNRAAEPDAICASCIMERRTSAEIAFVRARVPAHGRRPMRRTSATLVVDRNHAPAVLQAGRSASATADRSRSAAPVGLEIERDREHGADGAGMHDEDRVARGQSRKPGARARDLVDKTFAAGRPVARRRFPESR